MSSFIFKSLVKNAIKLKLVNNLLQYRKKNDNFILFKLFNQYKIIIIMNNETNQKILKIE